MTTPDAQQFRRLQDLLSRRHRAYVKCLRGRAVREVYGMVSQDGSLADQIRWREAQLPFLESEAEREGRAHQRLQKLDLAICRAVAEGSES